jgi:nitroreductase
MEKAREMLYSQLKKNAQKMNMLLILLPFMRQKMQPFSNKLNAVSENGIPSLHEAAHFIIVVEKKRVPPGFPPIEKQSIAHVMQNMWLTTTNLGLGFQLISETSILSQNARFLKLLGLSRGNYVIDGCVKGFPKTIPESKKEINIDDYATWI